MATKFVAAVALLALCHADPVLINGILYRDGRAYSVGQASSYGGGVSTAQAKVDDHAAHAFGSATGGGGGNYYPRQVVAQAQTYEAPSFPEHAYGAAKAVAQAQDGAYFSIPAPATVITYEQNFAPAASSMTHADSRGPGVAQSFASTKGGVGGFGATSSNSYTNGPGSADSDANSSHGLISSSAKTSGEGYAASSAQDNGFTGVVYPAAPAVLVDQPAPTVVDLRTPTYYTSYTPVHPAHGVASSNANVVGGGHAASSAKIGHGQGRTISWRFGTLYDAPASAYAQANSNANNGAAKSTAYTHGYGSAKANADVNNYGSAKNVADTSFAGRDVAQSSAFSHGAGSANANAKVHGHYYDGSKSSAEAQTYNSGSAVSSARTHGVNTAFRVTNSQANSSGPSSSAHANALSF